MIGLDGQGLAYLLSTPRSGSTLLGAILGSHSQVACPPEPWFMLPLLGVRDERLAVIAPYDHDLAQRATRDFVDESLFLDASKAFATTIYRARLDQAGKRVFVDKDTRYFHIAGLLAKLFPRALHIWLQRNPLDVIASYKNTWKVTASTIFGPIFSPNSFDLTASFDILHEHFSTAPKAILLRYEDLVARPAEIVEPLCQALDIPFEGGMLAFFRNDELMTSYSTSLFGDKKIHTEAAIHAKSVGVWRDVLTADEVRASLQVLGSQPFTVMGYDDTLAEALVYAGLNEAELTPGGRRDAYLEALRSYPKCNADTLLADPSLWPEAVSYTASIGLGQAFQNVIREKEAIIERLADEADARLDHLRAADAARAQLQQELEASQAAIREKEALMQAAVREAEARLERLNAELLERGRVIDELAATAEERLRLLEAATAEAAQLRLALADRSDEINHLVDGLRRKDEVIAEVSATAEERLRIVERLAADVSTAQGATQQVAEQLGDKEQALHRLAEELQSKERVIHELAGELKNKERVIVDLAEAAEERLRLIAQLSPNPTGAHQG